METGGSDRTSTRAVASCEQEKRNIPGSHPGERILKLLEGLTHAERRYPPQGNASGLDRERDGETLLAEEDSE